MCSSASVIEEIIFRGGKRGIEVWNALQKENKYRVSVGKPEENKLLGTPISRGEDNNKGF